MVRVVSLMKDQQWGIGSVTIVCLLAMILGCRPKLEPNAASKSNGLAVPEVETAPVIKKRIQEFREFTGRTEAANTVDVRARVSGYLLQSPRPVAGGLPSANYDSGADKDIDEASQVKVEIMEGSKVQRGSLLYLIDPAPYELVYAQAKGSLQATQAQLQRFQLDLARSKELLDTKSISQADYDLAVANANEAAGQIANLQAAVDRARLDLEFTKVISPIDGFLGRSLVTNGNLINADQTILTTVVSTQPIYVYFNVDERSLLDYRTRIRSGSVKSARESRIEVRMGLTNEEGYPHLGYIDFVDNTTNPATGNTQLRGTFDNADGALTPGLFARVSSPFTEEYEAHLVPTRAIAMDQQGHYLLLVENGKVKRQSVELGEVYDASTVVTAGLKGDETIIVNGLQRLRAGMSVKVKEIAPKPTPESDDVSQVLSSTSPKVALQIRTCGLSQACDESSHRHRRGTPL